MNAKVIGIIAIVVIGAAIGSVALSLSGPSDQNGDLMPVDDTPSADILIADTSMIQGEVKIGMLTPLTEDLAYQGNENVEAVNLAIRDFNKYLADSGEDWSLSVVVEDTQTKPTVALEKLTSFNAKGISAVIGPETSASLRNIKGYADSNNMLLVSCCSTAPALSIANDNVYRLIPDDLKQGKAVGKMMQDASIEVMVPIWRGDTWGDGLADSSIESFESRGGMVAEGIRYNPEAIEFSASASLLAETVQEQVDMYGADKVGVLTIGFGETLQFMQSAASHDVLNDIRWFGSDGLANDPRITEDAIGAQFATDIQLITTLFAVVDNPKYREVAATLEENLGWAPKTYAYSVYDSVWVVGLAMQKAQNTSTEDMTAVIDQAADEYYGVIGDIKFNEAGDLAASNYDLWGVVDGEWMMVGTWSHEDDSITMRDI